MSATEDPFSPASVAAITQHMNRDRVEDNLMIVHALGRKPTAIGGQLLRIDPGGATFEAYLSNGSEVSVVVPWASTPTTTDEVRAELDRMYTEACAQLGVPVQARNG